MSASVTLKSLRIRRSIAALLIAVGIIVLSNLPNNNPSSSPQEVLAQTTDVGPRAADLLETIPVKGRASKTGYSRSEYGEGWGQVGSCDMRNIMLKRYLIDLVLADNDCVVLSGTLQDLYTGKTISFVRGSTTSDDVQIDHVVALSDSWQKGAQVLSSVQRVQFANDPLNLIPVDGPANQQKGDSDAASWLPPNKSYRCQYIARQIAVKSKYRLWVTEAEKAAMKRVLNGCGEQVVPVEISP